MEDHLKEAYRFVLFNSTAGLTLVVALDEEKKGTDMIDQLEDICKECRKILEVTVTIGVGHRCSDLGHLFLSCQSAVDALGYKAIVGAGKTIYINDVEPVGRGRLQMDVKDESELINAVKFGPKEKIRSVVHGLVDRMEEAKVHLRQYQLFMLSISNCLLQLMQQYDLDPGDLLSTQKHYSDILSFNLHREEFEEWIIETACQMNDMMNRERDNTTRRVILEAKRYIQEHYQNPELSVEMLCREFHMSPAYFSTVFKRETGQSYVGYLTDVRLSKAVELLETTDDKTYVIAEKVGYQEQNYFSYVFKKRFGVSPTKYPQRQVIKNLGEIYGESGEKRTVQRYEHPVCHIYLFYGQRPCRIILIGVSLYGRLSGQLTATISQENQAMLSQVNRSVDSYLQTIMKLSDSLYYGVIKNADLSDESVSSDFTLLYDNNKDCISNIALLSKEGELLAAVPGRPPENRPGCDKGALVSDYPGADGQPVFYHTPCAVHL